MPDDYANNQITESERKSTRLKINILKVHFFEKWKVIKPGN